MQAHYQRIETIHFTQKECMYKGCSRGKSMVVQNIVFKSFKTTDKKGLTFHGETFYTFRKILAIELVQRVKITQRPKTLTTHFEHRLLKRHFQPVRQPTPLHRRQLLWKILACISPPNHYFIIRGHLYP